MHVTESRIGLTVYAVMLQKVKMTNCVCSHVTESKKD